MIRFRRAALALLVSLCLWVLVSFAPTPIRAQYDYQDKVLTVQSSNLIAYWPLNELSGTSANDLSSNNFDGTYNGVTLDQIDGPGPTTGRAGLWDGINDYVTIFTSGLGTAFNAETGTMAAWIKVDASFWTDNAYHPAVEIGKDGNNRYGLWKFDSSAGNDLIAFVVRGATQTTRNIDTTSTAWLHFAMTWDTGANELIGYLNGNPTAITTIGGAFSGPPTFAYVGRSGIYWSGYIQHVALWDVALPESDIDILADPSGLPTPTPSNTPIATNTPTPTPTLPFGEHIILSSGKEAALYYQVDTGQFMLSAVGLIQVGLLMMLVFLAMLRRRRD